MRRVVLIALFLLCWLVPASASVASESDDRVVVVGPVSVERDETVGDVIVVDGDVDVRGTVDGDIVVASGDITIRGRVTGDVVAFSGQTTLGRRGRVDGDIQYGDKRPVLAGGAKVDGKIEKFSGGDFSVIGAIAFWIAISVSLLIFGLLLLLLAPKAADALARTAKKRKFIAFLVGLLLCVLLPIIAVVLCITIVGIPLGLGLLLALLPIYALAYVTAAFVLGRFVIKKSRILAFIAGLLVLQLLTLIPIAGGLIGLLATALGLGTLALATLGARS